MDAEALGQMIAADVCVSISVKKKKWEERFMNAKKKYQIIQRIS